MDEAAPKLETKDEPPIKHNVVNASAASDPLYRFIKMCARVFYDEKELYFFAPYFAVVQSSGMGKSTALFETGKRFKFFQFLLLNVEKYALFPGSPEQWVNAKAIASSFIAKVKLAANLTDAEDAENAMIEAISDVLQRDRKSTRLNSSHVSQSRMPSSA